MSDYDKPPSGGGYDAPPPQPPGGGGYGAPPPPPPGGGYGGAYGQPPKTDPKAIWALVLGILGLVCCSFFTAIPALILGKMSQSSIDTSGGALQGRGMATAGFILGIVGIAFGVIYLVLVFAGVIEFNTTFSTSP